MPSFHSHEEVLSAKAHFFPHALDIDVDSNEWQWEPLPVTVLERTMTSFVNAITDKPNWQEKVLDETIVAKWKQEALEADGYDMSEQAFEWCIAELREKAEEHKTCEFTPVLDSTAVIVKSDDIVPSDLRDELRRACQPLLDLPEAERDYHPRSDDLVVNLVHPSLFPVVYGTTRAIESGPVGLADCVSYTAKGMPIPVPTSESEYYSNKYQWLPCDVLFETDDKVRIASYVNNLHPDHHSDLYAVLEKCIGKAIPMWNRCLVTHESARNKDKRRIQCWEVEWDSPEPDYEDPPSDLDELDLEDGLDPEEVEMHGLPGARWRSNRQIAVPQPPAFESGPRPWAGDGIDLRRDFAEQGLQIIVKLASIELTPEKPVYNGGSWHVEGMLNERIVATAIYYYSSENVTENELHFRTHLHGLDDYGAKGKYLEYDQNDYGNLEQAFGLVFDDGGHRLQDVGSVVTREGRMLAFPNTLQHAVSPLELVDRSKPGHRRILVLWLVDPHIRIPSTAHVGPQQRDWWAPAALEKTERLSELPGELSDMIIKHVEDVPMSLTKAKELRLDLMDERSRSTEKFDEELHSNTYFFCEH